MDAELIAFCKKKLEDYKVPESIDLVEDLPKSTAQKILKKELKQKYWQESWKQGFRK
jgi:acyl-CoA synthetase (AMP-forming)/AMP-acid ligase II